MTVWNTTLVCRFILNELRFLQALKNILKKNPLSPSELSLANWAVCSFLGRPLVVYSTYDYFSDTNRPLCVFVFHFVPSTFFAFAQRNLQRQNLEMKSVQCAKCPKHSVVIDLYNCFSASLKPHVLKTHLPNINLKHCQMHDGKVEFMPLWH